MNTSGVASTHMQKLEKLAVSISDSLENNAMEIFFDLRTRLRRLLAP